MSEAVGDEAVLLAAADRRQMGGLRLTLLSFVLAIIGAALALLAPATMLGGRLHVLLGLVSVGWLFFMLVDSIRSFNPLHELILANSAAELYIEEQDISQALEEIERNAGV
jgi:hypothetical protein